MADGSAPIPLIRSGLCHGPSCTEKITEKGGSPDFCSDGCQARWSAAHVGAEPDPAQVLPVTWRRHDDGRWTRPVAPTGALLPAPLSFEVGQRLTIGVQERREFEVTEAEPGRAVLTPVDALPMPEDPRTDKITYLEDAAYWGLTDWEQMRFYGRISSYYGRIAARHRACAVRFGHASLILGLISLSFWVLALLIQIVGWVIKS